MKMPIVSYITDRMPFGNSLYGLSNEKLHSLMQQTNAPSWHEYAIVSRKWRRHACTACRWLNEILPKEATIFEPGCGSGANLIWLAQKGFIKLCGADIEVKAIELGENLASILSVSLNLWEEDGMNPIHIPKDLDAILSVNWLYHIPNAKFSDFLSCYREYLKIGGYIACDMVTRHYDNVPNNQWHTKDIKLPIELCRPSEYTIRLDPEEVNSIALRQGFASLKSTRFIFSRPQRAVYLLRRVE